MKSKVNREQNVFQIALPKEAPLRVLIVGQDSLLNGLLANAVMNDLGCDAITMQSADLLRALGTNDSTLVIISADLDSKPGAGFDLAARVSCAHPGAPIVILLDVPTRAAVSKAFHCGARGVFDRQESITEFIDCIEHVRRGLLWAGKEACDAFLEAFRSLPNPGRLTEGDSKTLTKRELQVVQCAARGKSNKTIACELCLSEHTVKNYLFRAFQKLGTSSRAELLFYLTVQGHSLGPSRTAQVKPTGAM
jgi:two-component system nitrate/nitrite response regulator NarL